VIKVIPIAIKESSIVATILAFLEMALCEKYPYSIKKLNPICTTAYIVNPISKK